MKNYPLVSILMNCYNAGSYINEAIESVINQTYKNWELIVWDDASTDNTLEIVKNFKDKRINLFKNEKNLGLGQSRIKASKKINGEYISILDADDKFSTKKLEKQINYMIGNKDVGLLATNFEIIDKKSNVLKKNIISNLNKNFLDFLCYTNIFAASSIIYRKKIAENLGWFSESFEYSQDFDFTLKFLKKSKIDFIDENLVSIRRTTNSMSSDKNLRLIREIEKQKILYQITADFNLTPQQESKNINTAFLSKIKHTIFDEKSSLSKIVKILTMIIFNPLKISFLIKYTFKKLFYGSI